MTTLNGGLFAYTHHDHKLVAVVGVSCQTDFAERTDLFQNSAETIAQHVACSTAETLKELLAEELITSESSESVGDFIKGVEKELGEEVKIITFSKQVF